MNFLQLSKATIFSGLSAILSYTLTIYLARIGGPEKYGFYAYCINWSGLIATFIGFSSSNTFSHLVTINKSKQVAFNIALAVKILLLTIILIIFPLLHKYFSVPLMALFFIIPVFYLGGIYEYDKKNVRFSAYDFFEKILLLSLNVLVIQIYGFSSIIFFVYACVTLFILYLQMKDNLGLFTNFSLPKLSLVRNYVNKYWPVFFVLLSQIAYGNISRLIIEQKFGVTTFAVVTISFQIIAIAQILQVQIDRIFRPQFIKSFINKDNKKVKMLILKYFKYGTLPLICFSLLIKFYSSIFINYAFGEEYLDASRYLSYLYPIIISVNLIRLSDIIFIALDKLKLNLIINFSFSLLMLIAISIISSYYPIDQVLESMVIFQFLQVLATLIVLVKKYI